MAALLWSAGDLRGRRLGRLLGAIAAGLAGALALVSLLTLVRTGSLPQLGRTVEFARIFAVSGFNQIPLPGIFGLPLIVYGTFSAGIVAATVLAIDREPNRVLIGMLAWSGVFGLGSSSYYVVRAHPDVLPMTFSAWSLTVALLAFLAIRHLATARSPRTPVALATVLLAMGAIACSLAQTPTPWGEIHRIVTPQFQITTASPYLPSSNPQDRRVISSIADGPRRFVVRRGAPIAILATTGHRIADAYGVVNVSPYTGGDSIVTVEQLEATLDALRDAGGNTLLTRSNVADFCPILRRRGFAVATASGLRSWRDCTDIQGPPEPITAMPDLVKWVDTRHLHPRALR